MTDRELDALVAEKVMGEPMPSPPSDQDGDLAIASAGRLSPAGAWVVVSVYAEGDVPRWAPMPYSTDIAAAWRVVEERMPLSRIERRFGGWRVQFFDGGRRWEAEAETAPRAICLAVLEATDPSFKKGGDSTGQESREGGSAHHQAEDGLHAGRRGLRDPAAGAEEDQVTGLCNPGNQST